MRQAVSTMTRVTGLLGYPVQHSLSPTIHNAGFEAAGIDATYLCFEVPPSELGTAIEGVKALGLWGVNLTTPHKLAVLPYLDRLAPSATTVGSVNTVTLTRGDSDGSGPLMTVGHNTDAGGLVRALRGSPGLGDGSTTPLLGTRGIVIGAGGAARAAAVALHELGVSSLVIVNRTHETAELLIEDLARSPGFDQVRLLAYDLTAEGFARATAQSPSVVIQATTLGMAAGPDAGRSPTMVSWLQPLEGAIGVDLVYRPAVTPFMRQAAEAGMRVVHGVGLRMLVFQACLAWELWTGRPAPVRAMWSAVGQKSFPGRRSVHPNRGGELS